MTTTDKLIARLPEDDRRQLLDAVVATRQVQRGDVVVVEHAYTRKLDEAQQTVGRIVGLAYAAGGSSTHVLVVNPIDPGKRMVALSAAHVCRIRWARYAGDSSLKAETNPANYRAGDVLAGPPLERTTA